MFHPEFSFSKESAEVEQDGKERQNKELRFQEMLKEVESWRDAVGASVDDGVKKTLAALNLSGITTLASCEGHVDGGRGAPWIEIGNRPVPSERFSGEREIFQQVAQKYGVTYEDVKRDFHEEAHIEASRKASRKGETPEYKRWRQANEALADKLNKLLTEFYRDHEVAPDDRLISSIKGWGAIWLHNGGNDFELGTSDLNQEQQKLLLPRLQRHQSELHAFAQFLRAKWLQD